MDRQRLSIGAIDKILTPSAKFFTLSLEAIMKATREEKEGVDNTGWRVDGVNCFL